MNRKALFHSVELTLNQMDALMIRCNRQHHHTYAATQDINSEDRVFFQQG